MKPDAILRADLLDIVFENRNKEYGAYVLRRDYNRRLLIALGSLPVLLFTFFLMSTGVNQGEKTQPVFQPEKKDYELKQVEIPKPVLPKPAAAPAPKVATIKNPPPVIVPDNVKTTPLPSIDELMKDKALIGLENIDGPPPLAVIAPPATPPGNGAVAGEAIAEKEKVLTHADKMPEFPGGIEALRRFLGRNLRVPEQVMEPGQRVRLPVRFVVSKEGALKDVEFLVPVDEAFRKEVLRVLNKMPDWKPGYQSGRPVPVYFVIPIIFEMPE